MWLALRWTGLVWRRREQWRDSMGCCPTCQRMLSEWLTTKPDETLMAVAALGRGSLGVSEGSRKVFPLP